MFRTSVAALLGLVAAGLIGLGVNAASENTAPPSGVSPNAMALQECAKACDDCKRTCDMCSAHCAAELTEGHKLHLETLRTCQDCASLCAAAGSVVARHGPFADIACSACADACKRCGDACEKHAAHDPMMKQCAEECRTCEKACREMLKHIQAGNAPK